MPREQALPASKSAETARLWLVRAIMLFYACLLGEGVLRKWLVPGASNALVFLRDPVMLLVLLAYARMRPSVAMRAWLAGYGLVSLAFVLCCACQAFTTATPAVVLLVGLRNYLFFAPLCLAIRDAFTAEDYARWLRLNVILAVPSAALVTAQYFSAPSSILNVAPGGENDGVFLLVENVVRPYGLFSFALGHSAFAAWMVGTVLAALMAGPPLGLARAPVALGAACVALMGVLSGSRTYFLFAAACLLVFVAVAGLFGTARARRAGLLAGGGLIVAAGLAMAAIPSLADNLLDRQETAVAAEGSTLDRLGTVVTAFVAEADRVPLFGVGLGSGTNVANFLANGRTDHVLAEYELTRVVQELGLIFGLGYIAVRWGLLATFGWLTVRAAMRGNLQPACFFGFLLPVFLAHDITLQNTMIGVAWFAAGIFLSAVRVGGSIGVPREPVTRPRIVGRPA